MLDRSDFVLTHPAAHRADAAAIDRLSTALAERHGLLDATNRRRFAGFVSLVNHVYPRGPAHAVAVAAIWCNWLFFFDDAHDEGDGHAADERALRETIARHLGVLRGTRRPDPTDPLSSYAATFRRLARQRVSDAWLDRFAASAEAYLVRGTLEAWRHHRTGTTTAVDEYLARRDHDSAVQTALDLIELVHGVELPAAVLADPALHALQQACVRTVACFNDIVSYPKEVLVQKNPNNLVHVLGVEEGLGYEAAVRAAVRITNDAAREIPSLEAELLSRHPLPIVVEYTRGVRAWQRGNIELSLREPRYRSAASPFAELREKVAA